MNPLWRKDIIAHRKAILINVGGPLVFLPVVLVMDSEPHIYTPMALLMGFVLSGIPIIRDGIGLTSRLLCSLPCSRETQIRARLSFSWMLILLGTIVFLIPGLVYFTFWKNAPPLNLLIRPWVMLYGLPVISLLNLILHTIAARWTMKRDNIIIILFVVMTLGLVTLPFRSFGRWVFPVPLIRGLVAGYDGMLRLLEHSWGLLVIPGVAILSWWLFLLTVRLATAAYRRKGV